MSIDLEKIDAERAAPPPTLYKYVVADRIDVLKNHVIRFTPPINTNDIFEVRQTFDLLAGPKMLELFEAEARTMNMDEQLARALAEMSLGEHLSTQDAKMLIQHAFGQDFTSMARGFLSTVVEDKLVPLMNSSDRINDLLVKLGSDLICLSLSDRPYSSPMWAHYAGNSTGFAIAFSSDNSFFRRGDAGERQGLYEIQYFDGKIVEVLDDPYAALMSKTADWAYEHEWRLYVKASEAIKVFEVGSDQIHLVEFPREAVSRVILGVRAGPELEGDLRSILAADYPGVPLFRLKADRMTATLTEMPA